MTNITTEPKVVKREYPDRPIVGVGGVVLQNGLVVLVRRAKAPRMGEWSIPGGMLELGETLRDGVAREIEEETGLKVKSEEVLDVFDSIVIDADGKTQYHYVLIDFLCSVTGGELRAASDASEARWATLEEVLGLVKREITVGVIRKGFSKARDGTKVSE
ncbi:MAG: NUDIX hydrolase [Candidatus Korobacteraceae bacterium]|jgi:ADP-ribose pyrophosphatase YjhB (NUDIX family)